ncbi:Glycosaminoglycan xylosylkinase [Mactra antiquata]
MKHKLRIALVVMVIIIIIITGILFEELSTMDWSHDYDYDNGFQRKMEEAMGYTKDLDPSLKNMNELKFHLLSKNNNIDKFLSRSKQNTTVMYDTSVERLFKLLESIPEFRFSRKKLRNGNFEDMVLRLSKYSRTQSPFLYDQNLDIGSNNYRQFHQHIRYSVLYDTEDPVIDGLIHDMSSDTITSVEMMEEGTELKLFMKMKKGTEAVFKPMRWGREHETLPNHYYFNDYERHNSEIAAFHLDRILGFYRVPPVTGRLVNMTSEIFRLAGKTLRRTFYVSPIGNLCFFGVCKYYCDSRHSFCGNVDMIEGSLMVWLPDDLEAERRRWKSPYRRSYSKFRKAEWEENEDYCINLLDETSVYKYPRYILDLVDTHIFDFITGNMDRHHSEIFEAAGNDSFLIHMDNGRGFGKANVDEYSIITPLRQCCLIRKSTFIKLAKLYIGPERLSNLLDMSTRKDPLYPVVIQGHLNAVDRRVLHILTLVAECVKGSNSVDDVIIEDGY